MKEKMKTEKTTQENVRPIWVRAPKSGVEFYSGLTRSKLYELAANGHIRSVSIREPGQVKGTRLFHLQSILDYIAKCEQRFAETAPETPAATTTNE